MNAPGQHKRPGGIIEFDYQEGFDDVPPEFNTTEEEDFAELEVVGMRTIKLGRRAFFVASNHGVELINTLFSLSHEDRYEPRSGSDLLDNWKRLASSPTINRQNLPAYLSRAVTLLNTALAPESAHTPEFIQMTAHGSGSHSRYLISPNYVLLDRRTPQD